MKYSPKRSSARWLESAPEYLLACYDNNGRTCDRYTVLFGAPLWTPNMGRTIPLLILSAAPSSPQGVSMWGEMPAYNRAALGRKVRWLDLPEHIRRHVIARATED